MWQSLLSVGHSRSQILRLRRDSGSKAGAGGEQGPHRMSAAVLAIMSNVPGWGQGGMTAAGMGPPPIARTRSQPWKVGSGELQEGKSSAPSVGNVRVLIPGPEELETSLYF